MKYSVLCVAFAAATVATSAAAASYSYTSSGSISATYSGSGVVGAGSHGLPELNAYRKQHAINDIVQEGRDLRKADGGTLTAEHHAYLQAKLKAILTGNY